MWKEICRSDKHRTLWIHQGETLVALSLFFLLSHTFNNIMVHVQESEQRRTDLAFILALTSLNIAQFSKISRQSATKSSKF